MSTACSPLPSIEGDGCDSNCTLSGCGNGIFISGELCYPGQAFATGGEPRSIAAGDWNGDGNLDLAVAGSNSVSVLLFEP